MGKLPRVWFVWMVVAVSGGAAWADRDVVHVTHVTLAGGDVVVGGELRLGGDVRVGTDGRISRRAAHGWERVGKLRFEGRSHVRVEVVLDGRPVTEFPLIEVPGYSLSSAHLDGNELSARFTADAR